MRVGQALGLRHEDVVTQERRIEIVAREDNANGARGKQGAGCVPVTGELIRCYSDYMHVEYGELDSDYVFVNLWGGQVGRAMSYANVNEIVSRTRVAARVSFHPAHVPAHVRDARAAGRGTDRDRQQAADAQLDPDHQRDLSAFLARGPPRRARARRRDGEDRPDAVSGPALALVAGSRPLERSWEEMLLEAVLPEFQVEVYHAEPGDPVLHGPTCAVGGCPVGG